MRNWRLHFVDAIRQTFAVTKWRGTQVASHLPSVPLASLGEMLSPKTLCTLHENLPKQIFREVAAVVIFLAGEVNPPLKISA